MSFEQSPLSPTAGGTGINNGTKTINLGSPTAGFFLTSDASGNGTWQAGGGGGSYISLSPYIVGKPGDTHAGFTTIQSAIDQAVLDGASETNVLNIYVKPGTYAENLIGSSGINIICFNNNAWQYNQLSGLSGLVPLPTSSVILNGSITFTGNTNAEFFSIVGMTQVQTAAGNGIIMPLRGTVFLTNFNMILKQGTMFKFESSGSDIANLCAKECNFLSDGSGGGVQVYVLTNGAVQVDLCFESVNISIADLEIVSTIELTSILSMYANYSCLQMQQSFPDESFATFNLNWVTILSFPYFIVTTAATSPSVTISATYSNLYKLINDQANVANLSGIQFCQVDTFTGVPLANKAQQGCVNVNTGSLVCTPNGAVSTTPTVALGTAYQNTLGYDAMITVYINVTVAAGGSILCGVGGSSPTQQTLYNNLSVVGVVPVSVYVPANRYVKISTSGTITAAITGQQAMPI